MKFTFKLHNKSKESAVAVEVLSLESQDMPICMLGTSSNTMFCGLLDQEDAQNTEN